MGMTPDIGLRTHGGSRRPEYRAWINMRRRCINPGEAKFKDYGARGIGVCQRWFFSFELFLEDMGPRPSPKHSLDRINNDGHYEPGNCRWATSEQQANNTRRTKPGIRAFHANST